MRFGPKHSRVRDFPQIYGELPAACLAEEIETPGEGQVRALFTIAGNPALSAPNGDRLAAALDTLECLVCVDSYLNETSRRAHVILPPPSPLERSHYDLAFYQLSIRNIAHYSPPVFPRAAETLEEWEILLRLTGIAAGQGPNADVSVIDDLVVHQLVSREVRTKGSSVEGREATELLTALQPRRGPERLLDFLLRVGPYGDAFGAEPKGLTLARSLPASCLPTRPSLALTEHRQFPERLIPLLPLANAPAPDTRLDCGPETKPSIPCYCRSESVANQHDSSYCLSPAPTA